MVDIFSSDNYKCIFLMKMFAFLININSIDNKSALVQVIDWCRMGNKHYLNPLVVKICDTIWVRSRRYSCLVTWFCDHLTAKPGNKTAAPSWPNPCGLVLLGLNELKFFSASFGKTVTIIAIFFNICRVRASTVTQCSVRGNVSRMRSFEAYLTTREFSNYTKNFWNENNQILKKKMRQNIIPCSWSNDKSTLDKIMAWHQ